MFLLAAFAALRVQWWKLLKMQRLTSRTLSSVTSVSSYDENDQLLISENVNNSYGRFLRLKVMLDSNDQSHVLFSAKDFRITLNPIQSH